MSGPDEDMKNLDGYLDLVEELIDTARDNGQEFDEDEVRDNLAEIIIECDW